MTTPLVLVADRDAIRRRAVVEAVSALASARVIGVDGLDAARTEIMVCDPVVLIAPWEERGRRGLSLREASRSPYLLLLSSRSDSERIAAAFAAGRTEIIPCVPLDLGALRNRVSLLLWGPEAIVGLAGRGHAGLDLSGSPALRRRLGAA